MVNRRKRFRFMEQNDVLIRTSLNKYQGTGITGTTYDLSTGGARILTKKTYAVGSVIRLRIDLAKTDQCVTVDGEVVWLKAADEEGLYEIGVEFRNMSSHTILALIKHLYGDQSRAPLPPFCRVDP